MNRARAMRAPQCSEEILEAQPAAVAGIFLAVAVVRVGFNPGCVGTQIDVEILHIHHVRKQIRRVGDAANLLI